MTIERQQRFAWWVMLASLLCCVFEGALRKWVIGDTSILARLAYLSKFICLSLFLIQLPRKKNYFADVTRHYLQAGVTLLCLGAFVSSFYGFDVEGAVLSVINFMLLPAAAWMGGRVLPSQSLMKYARTIVLLALAVAPLGIVQFYSPPSSPINRYSRAGESIATASISERVRATGTFSYISGFSEFATVAVWAGLLVVSTAKDRLWRNVGFSGLLAGYLCTFVTVSRGTALISLGLLVVWTIFGGNLAKKWQGAVMFILILAAVAVNLGAMEMTEEIITTVYRRHQGASDSLAWRIWYSFILPLDAIFASPFGIGFGSEVGGRFANTSAEAAGVVFESAWGRTVNQVGVFGLVGMLLTWGIAFVPPASLFRRASHGGFKSAAAITLAALGARAIVGYQFNHVAAYFFWSMAACALALGKPSTSIVQAPSRDKIP